MIHDVLDLNTSGAYAEDAMRARSLRVGRFGCCLLTPFAFVV